MTVVVPVKVTKHILEKILGTDFHFLFPSARAGQVTVYIMKLQ
jgi:hypothetical protein